MNTYSSPTVTRSLYGCFSVEFFCGRCLKIDVVDRFPWNFCTCFWNYLLFPNITIIGRVPCLRNTPVLLRLWKVVKISTKSPNSLFLSQTLKIDPSWETIIASIFWCKLRFYPKIIEFGFFQICSSKINTKVLKNQPMRLVVGCLLFWYFDTSKDLFNSEIFGSARTAMRPQFWKEDSRKFHETFVFLSSESYNENWKSDKNRAIVRKEIEIFWKHQ